MCCVSVSSIACMSPTCNGSTVFERSNAIKIRNEIMFDFYPGLPQIVLFHLSEHHLISLCLVRTISEIQPL